MDKIYGIIYKATNKINGKMYIGQTIQSLGRRILQHINDALSNKDDMYFHNAIRKHGKENFIWEIVAECNSLEKLNKTEVEMIKKYSTFGNGYNLNYGGEGNAGFERTEETRRKMSKSHIGKTHSEKTKERMSKSRAGKKSYMYGKYGKDNPNFGKTRTEKTKRKISESQKGEKNHMYGRRGIKSPLAKKYIITTPWGEEIFIHGLADFCRKYEKEKLHCSTLVLVAKGKYKYTKGYKCKYWEEER